MLFIMFFHPRKTLFDVHNGAVYAEAELEAIGMLTLLGFGLLFDLID